MQACCQPAVRFVRRRQPCRAVLVKRRRAASPRLESFALAPAPRAFRRAKRPKWLRTSYLPALIHAEEPCSLHDPGREVNSSVLEGVQGPEFVQDKRCLIRFNIVRGKRRSSGHSHECDRREVPTSKAPLRFPKLLGARVRPQVNSAPRA